MQQEAWDAVLPDWRRGLQLINHREAPGRMTDEELSFLSGLSDALRADDHRLAGAWYQLLMQDLYRSCPALGGWFPD